MDGPLKIHQGGVFEPLMVFGKGHEVLELSRSGWLVVVKILEDFEGFFVLPLMVELESFREVPCGLCRRGAGKKESRRP